MVASTGGPSMIAEQDRFGLYRRFVDGKKGYGVQSSWVWLVGLRLFNILALIRTYGGR